MLLLLASLRTSMAPIAKEGKSFGAESSKSVPYLRLMLNRLSSLRTPMAPIAKEGNFVGAKSCKSVPLRFMLNRWSITSRWSLVVSLLNEQSCGLYLFYYRQVA